MEVRVSCRCVAVPLVVFFCLKMDKSSHPQAMALQSCATSVSIAAGLRNVVGVASATGSITTTTIATAGLVWCCQRIGEVQMIVHTNKRVLMSSQLEKSLYDNRLHCCEYDVCMYVRTMGHPKPAAVG